ncbi:MAG: TIGR03619 family F420-dependent LLM class oxidoreductase [Gammaproteobacteria bacterium]|nr:TIGR03619 family F420-dependent LLM class oxidoreductase [Gammaproteobacteria bacterium]
MRFGFYLPTRGPLARPGQLTDMAMSAERCGFHSAVIADHVVIPGNVASSYPYTVSGAFVGEDEALEQLSLMSYIGAKTERLRLVASVMVLPQRNPVVTAKMLATINVLTGGRVTVGVGVGWMREEFEALHAPDFAARGAVSDEYLEIFKRLWTEEQPSFQGKHYQFAPVHFAPKPVQRPHPPIWIGGHSKPALRRVAKLGDGWHPVGATAASALPPAEVAQKKAAIHAMAEGYGRAPGAIEIAYKAPIYDGGRAPDGQERRFFSGSAEAIIADIEQFANAGVDELIFDFRSATLAESLERMEWFAQEILAAAADL